MKWNHAYDLAFSVELDQEDWLDGLKMNKKLIRQALLKRVEDLFKTEDYLEGITGFDSYEVEDRR